ncbi:MAG TPA: TonB-dependent receptor [Cyclobacteriaceae bacterium]|nr:TonB-dependent receptor [Cyclobacteriaceae bacterium]
MSFLLRPKLLLKSAACVVLLQLFFVQASLAQSQTVSGKVTAGGTAEGVPGVTIVLKGTSQGATTDINGEYRINVPDGNAVLVFSSIGYTTQEVTVGAQSTINIDLAEALTSLDEIVVVGYGTMKKADVTGAVASVGEKSLREMPAVVNPGQLLQGRVSGVDVTNAGNKPGDGVAIQVRGRRSVNAGNDPLFVIDGIPVTADAMNSINPSDIVSMDVLKDASSTAIYGSRGANGVIIVTTKRGTPGKVRVNYNSSFGIQTMMKRPNLMNGEEMAEYKRESRRAIGQYNDADPVAADKALFTATELESIALGRSTDWYGMFVEQGYVNNQNLSINGGTESTRFNVSLGLFDNKGLEPNQKFTRYNTRINLDQKIGKALTFGISSLATYSLSNALDVDPLYSTATGSDYGAFSENPLGVPYDANGNLIFRASPGDGNRTNPLFDIDPKNVINRRKQLRLFNSAYAEVNIAKGLKFRMNYGPDMLFGQLGNFRASNTQAAAGGVNIANTENSFTFSSTWENILTYNRTFAEKHRFDFTGLYSRQTRTAEVFGSEGRGLPLDSFEYYNLGAASTNLVISSNYSKWSIASYMARFNYVFDDRFLVTLTGRADGSSKFVEVNKFGYFPSLALGWNIINEDWFAGSTTFTNLRLRASYGATGNEGIPPYGTNGLLLRTGYLYGDTPAFGYVPQTVANPAIKWETTRTANFGIDYELFSGRISGALEVYQSNTTDLLLPRLLPNTTGFNSILTNVGATRNTGIEFIISTLNKVAVAPGGFTWNTDFNISHNKEQIVELSQGKVDDVGNLRFIGQPLTVFYDFERIGIWQTGEEQAAAQGNSGVGYIKVKDQNGDGIISPNDDRKVLGSTVPIFTAGMTNRFTYKGFDLSIVMYARVGQMLQDITYGANRFNSGRVNQFKLDYWTPNNPTNYIPRPNVSLDNTYFGTTLQYFDASFLKVRNINLGYNLPKAWVNAMRMESLNVYLSVQNPVFISSYVQKYNGVDPELPTRSAPVARTFMLGLNVNF